MERKRASETALSEKRKERRHQEEKETLRAQMAVDDTNRQILTDLKAEEKEREERNLYESFKDLQIQKQSQKHKENQQVQDRSDVSRNNQDDHALERQSPLMPDVKRVKKMKVTFANSLQETSPVLRDNQDDDVVELTADGSFDISKPASSVEKKLSASSLDTVADEVETSEWVQISHGEAIEDDDEPVIEEVIELPPPRECVQTEIRFTPRVFPTPSRESKAAEEEDWLLKNRKHINKHQCLNRTSEYDISETDRTSQAKGDDFFHSKDFQSAANAYAEAISATPSDNTDLIATCLSNRAACLLQLGEFEVRDKCPVTYSSNATTCFDFDFLPQECISDCSKALSYLPDTRDTDQSSRTLKHYRLKLKLFVRRGTAYCRVGQYSQAKADYGVACSMDNQNPQLRDDFMELVAMEKANELKETGDSIFRQGQDLDQAIQMYSDSLRLNPLSIACLSNRAACYLMQHVAKECIEDCTRALELLQQDTSFNANSDHGLAFFSVGPASGSAQRRAWVVKTLVRRGAAYLSLRELDNGEL
ncbi:unnamed protein product [Phytophthora lilii]|uniref:Unnamed protein product n=1 Tax=Phytophthora lilii TaxID=2077276 RepID=A0A9W7CJ32_9STRA|nr:unnamed protein product [Phytophthora lilii]